MTNSEPKPAADDHAAVDQPESTGRWLSRRARIIAGAVATAVLLGGGAYLMLGDPTSAKRSVVTVTAVVNGRPSVDRSIAEIDKQWRGLR